MSKSAVKRMKVLLEAERDALLSGNFKAVEEIAPQKEKLAAEFEGSDVDHLRSLSPAFARNTALLEAARDGVSLVLTTLKAQRQARETLSSYDSSGKATKISRPQRGTERRF